MTRPDLTRPVGGLLSKRTQHASDRRSQLVQSRTSSISVLRPKVLRITALLAGFVLVAPIAAHAEPVSRDLTVTVKVGTPESNVPLPRTDVSVHEAGSTEPLVQGVTAADGSVHFTVGGEAVSLEISAAWQGAPADLKAVTGHTLNGEDVEIVLAADHGSLNGYINARVDGEPMASLDGAAVQILRSGILIEELALSGSGEFASGALPVFGDAPYELAFLPPAGFVLASEQKNENAPILHPGEGIDMTIERYFDLVAEDDGSGDDDDSGEGREETPNAADRAPTPPANLPFPQPLGNIPGLNFQLPDGILGPDASTASLGTMLGNMSSATLQEMMEALRKAQGLMPLTDGQNRVLGFAFDPNDLADIDAFMRRALDTPDRPGHLTSEGLSSAGGFVAAFSAAANPLSRTLAFNGVSRVSMGDIDFATMDIESAMMAVQTHRAGLLETQLKEQLKELQNRNENLAALNQAASLLRTYLEERSSASYAEAVKALEDLGIDVSKFERVVNKRMKDAEGERLLQVVVPRIDSASNSQQMDMLRLQSLSGKRNEAFDMMTTFIKKMQDTRSSVIGNMRSEPTPIGSVMWDKGTLSGSFDLSKVKPGDHHVILNFEDFGTTIVAGVEVKGPELAATGSALVPVVLGAAGMGAFGLMLILGSESRRRRVALL